ncbi:MAG: EAL domain-containing protein [Gammaproteobacteria bacterium]|nr:EAL domain-containing protein [Gammaproteobacteria bacterium]
MNFVPPGWAYSLRVKLILAAVLVEVVMLTLLVGNSVRLMHSSLTELLDTRLGELNKLLSVSLATPLVQRDFATTQEILNSLRAQEGIEYLVLDNASGEHVASSGWSAIPKEHDDPDLLSSRVSVEMSGIKYGTLYYGVSTEFLSLAKNRIIREGAFIAIFEIILSAALLAALGLWLTRHIRALTFASEQIARGELPNPIPVRTRDEVGQLAHSFNWMAGAIRQRIFELGASEERFHAIADYTYHWESWYDAAQKLVWLNPSVERMTGYTVQECMDLGNFPFPLILEEDRVRAHNEYRVYVPYSRGMTEFRVRRKDGTVFWGQASWQPIYDGADRYIGIRSSIRDISAQKEAERALQANIDILRQIQADQRRLLSLSQQDQARMTSLLAAIKHGILFETADHRVAYYNPAFKLLWKIASNVNLSGRPIGDLLTRYAKAHPKQDDQLWNVFEVAEANDSHEAYEVVLADGRTVTRDFFAVRDGDSNIVGRLWMFEDVTKERQTAEQMIYLAERDSLTGLFNRHRFHEEMNRTLDIVQRKQSSGALLFFDLDGFKLVNDTFGHSAGDAILIRVANEVATLVRRGEVFSRFGGDEFAVCLSEAGQQDAEVLAERIVRSIGQIPFMFGERKLRLTASVGIALFPQHSILADELLMHADTAMYQAKESGKAAWCVYRPALDGASKSVARLAWNSRIQNALDNNLLRVHYQGIYSADGHRLHHMEALVRMVDETDIEQVIMPAQFISYAEKTGKIVEIDRWVILHTLETLARSPRLTAIAVNISGKSLDDPQFPQFIIENLRLYGVAPQRLMIELTETNAVSDLHDAQRLIERLQEHGCAVCLDDFGAGFASFTYLKHLRANILKIDGQFIRDLPHDADNQVFVKAMVEVAKGLNKQVIAEYVEDLATLQMLQTIGVDMVQGYFLHHPAPELLMEEALSA